MHLLVPLIVIDQPRLKVLNNTLVYFRYRYITQLKINNGDDAKQRTTSNHFGGKNHCAKKLLYVLYADLKSYRDEPAFLHCRRRRSPKTTHSP